MEWKLVAKFKIYTKAECHKLVKQKKLNLKLSIYIKVVEEIKKMRLDLQLEEMIKL